MHESFPETVLYFEGLTVDLRVEIDQSVKDGLALLGLGDQFGIITAFNPGVILSSGDNDRRTIDLRAELTKSRDHYVDLDACSPDKSHCEHSFAFVADRSRIIEIAKRREQLAIFWFDGNHFWIYDAITDTPPLKLPVK